METIFVYVDDAAYARQQLAPMLNQELQQPTHWVLVACAPRLTHRIGKWVSHSARENWRQKWAEKLYSHMQLASFAGAEDRVTPVLAKGALPELTRRLMTEYGVGRVLDARRPKFGQELPPVTHDQPARVNGRWEVPGALVGMGAVLVLAAE